MTRASLIIRFILAGLIVLMYLLYEGRQIERMSYLEDNIREDIVMAIETSGPIVELGILADLPQYKRDVDECNSLASKFAVDLDRIENRLESLKGRVDVHEGIIEKEHGK
jgi:hypothetical protein